jgi:hypothetical protein
MIFRAGRDPAGGSAEPEWLAGGAQAACDRAEFAPGGSASLETRGVQSSLTITESTNRKGRRKRGADASRLPLGRIARLY